MTQGPTASIHATSEVACIARSDISLRAALRHVPWPRILLGWIVAFAAGALVAAITIALGWWPGGAWERAVLYAVGSTVTPALDVLMLTLPLAGTNYTLAPLVLVAALLLWRRGYSTLAVHLAVVQLGSWTLNPALKFTFVRARPELFEPRGQYAFPAFPSGHVIAVVAVLGTVAYLLHRCGRGRWGYAAAGAFLVLVAYSRLYLGVHWPTDLLAGALVGAVWLWGSMRALEPMHRAAVAAGASELARDFHQGGRRTTRRDRATGANGSPA